MPKLEDIPVRVKLPVLGAALALAMLAATMAAAIRAVQAAISERSEPLASADVAGVILRGIALEGLIVLVISAGLFTLLARSLAEPAEVLARNAWAMATGNSLEADGTGGALSKRGDELGELAMGMHELGVQIERRRKAAPETALRLGAFQAASTPLLLIGPELTVLGANRAMQSLWAAHPDVFPAGTDFVGQSLAGVHGKLVKIAEEFSETGAQPVNELKFADRTIVVACSAIHDAAGRMAGLVMDWNDVTEQRIHAAFVTAIDASLMIARVDPQGNVTSVNGDMARMLGRPEADCVGLSLGEVLRLEGGSEVTANLDAGAAVSGIFCANGGAEEQWLAGGFTPVLDQGGAADAFVFLGADITEARRIAQKEQHRRANAEEIQRTVVRSLETALSGLAAGDLTTTIEQKFEGGNDKLRCDFNMAVKGLLEAMISVIENAESIRGEAVEINRAANDLSRRTEQQAATLEQTASSLDQLTHSVASAADGAIKAKSVVDDARANAEKSGTIVEQAVDAMGEIAQSSEEISKIIGVIDEIAFQTNLLALNAGVEAARAGDAGRGFAVVASEVRALAQRSSDAAREINDLISVSGANVGRGVNLVNETGVALREIVGSVGSIAELVSEIATSAHEQASGLAEINVAVTELDQVTQQNAAMFEQTSAAGQSLTNEAEMLTATTERFHVGVLRLEARAAPDPSSSSETGSADATVVKGEDKPNDEVRNRFASVERASSSGTLALAFDGDDWQEF